MVRQSFGVGAGRWTASRKLDHSYCKNFAKMKNQARRVFSLKRSGFAEQQIAFALQQASKCRILTARL